MARFQKLCVAATAATFALIGVGGLVRATGSGEGCPTWPGCFPGRLLPPVEYHALIEFSHRSVVILDSILIGLVAAVALISYRGIRRIVIPAVAAFGLIIVEAVLGAIVVKHGLSPGLVTAHLATATLLVGVLVHLTASVFCFVKLPAKGPALRGSDPAFARLAAIAAAAVFVLLLVGAYVRGRGAGLAFPDWPLMNGKLVPQLGGVASVMFVHRIVAAVVGLLVVYVAIRAWTAERRSVDLVVFSTLALGLFLAQVLIGAALVWTKLGVAPQVAHVLLSELIWGALVALATVSRRLAGVAPTRTVEAGTSPAPHDEGPAPRDDGPSLHERTVAYFQLTKPRIIVLLLITTIPAMILAADGMPSVLLIASTLFGGALAAGGANAFNCYLDRDIDEIMRRTRSRPLPSHRVGPENAVAFGYALGAISFFWLATTVNVLAGVLTLSALAFYVFVYTLWLKRTTTQNIVIGGAAGAVPVLVGWAAVTGSLALPAVLLFAVVFVWTPPHFWALSMRYAKDYAEAGVPMLPVVKGTRGTVLNILGYSVALVAVTLALYPVAGMGAVYLVAAVVLGAIFIQRAVRLWRSRTPALAMGLFRYSILYLGLLFTAVAVDRLIPLSL
ncbi:MAG: heme o synthase [Actinomycetota bacterium]